MNKIKAVTDFQDLYARMYADASRDWGEEKLNWDDGSQKKYGVESISHYNEEIFTEGYRSIYSFITPAFKTLQGLTESVERYRLLFDTVFGCSGYEIRE